MPYEQVCIRVDDSLIHELDRLAKEVFKRRSDVIRDALIAYVKRDMELKQLKELATQQYLAEKIDFNEYALIVGADTALELKIGKETLMESMKRAKKDSKDRN